MGVKLYEECKHCGGKGRIKVPFDNYDYEIFTEVIYKLADITRCNYGETIDHLQTIFPNWNGTKEPEFILGIGHRYFWNNIPKRIAQLKKETVNG